MMVLVYLAKLSHQIHTRINRVLTNKLPYCNLGVVFQTKCNLINIFTVTAKISVFGSSAIVYKFNCSGCNVSYYDEGNRESELKRIAILP